MFVQQYLYHCQVTAEDTAAEGFLVHEFKILEFHIAEVSDLGLLHWETQKVERV